MPSESHVKKWIKQAPSARILECGIDALNRIAEAGRIRFRDLPGMPRQYLREDVERVAAEAVKDPGQPTK
jgi:hypothetical protein